MGSGSSRRTGGAINVLDQEMQHPQEEPQENPQSRAQKESASCRLYSRSYGRCVTIFGSYVIVSTSWRSTALTGASAAFDGPQ